MSGGRDIRRKVAILVGLLAACGWAGRAQADVVVRADNLRFNTPAGAPAAGNIEFYIQTADQNPVEVGDYQFRVRLVGPSAGTDVRIIGGGETSASGPHPTPFVPPRLATDSQIVSNTEYFVSTISIITIPEPPGFELLPPLMLPHGGGVARIDFEVQPGVEGAFSFEILASPEVPMTEFLAGDFTTAIPYTMVHPVLTVSVASLPGDLDDSGFVGQRDLDLVLQNWAQHVEAGNKLMGDPSGDGFVSQPDLDTVLQYWAQGSAQSQSLSTAGVFAVPEPATLTLGVLAIPLLAGRRRPNGGA